MHDEVQDLFFSTNKKKYKIWSYSIFLSPQKKKIMWFTSESQLGEISVWDETVSHPNSMVWANHMTTVARLQSFTVKSVRLSFLLATILKEYYTK